MSKPVLAGKVNISFHARLPVYLDDTHNDVAAKAFDFNATPNPKPLNYQTVWDCTTLRDLSVDTIISRIGKGVYHKGASCCNLLDQYSGWDNNVFSRCGHVYGGYTMKCNMNDKDCPGIGAGLPGYDGPAYDYYTTTISVDCATALRMLKRPQEFGPVDDVEQERINMLCNGVTRERCCLGTAKAPDAVLTGGTQYTAADMCGEYWGPTNIFGSCNSVVLSYCKSPEGSKSPECACITSPFPIPECQDVRCANTNAARLSNMFLPCTEQSIRCEQWIQFDETARDNVVDGQVEQDCTIEAINVERPREGDTPLDESAVSTVQIVIVVVIFIVIIVTAIVVSVILYNSFSRNKRDLVRSERKAQKERETADIIRRQEDLEREIRNIKT